VLDLEIMEVDEMGREMECVAGLSDGLSSLARRLEDNCLALIMSLTLVGCRGKLDVY